MIIIYVCVSYIFIFILSLFRMDKKTAEDIIKKAEEKRERSRLATARYRAKLRKELTPEITERAAVLANLKKQIATAKVNAQRAATIKAQEEIEATK